MGVASFILAVASGMLFLILLAFVAYLTRQVESTPGPPDYDAGVGVGVAGITALSLLSEVVALGLGVAGVLQGRRKRMFAFLGIACSIVVLAIACVQDLVL